MSLITVISARPNYYVSIFIFINQIPVKIQQYLDQKGPKLLSNHIQNYNLYEKFFLIGAQNPTKMVTNHYSDIV